MQVDSQLEKSIKIILNVWQLLSIALCETDYAFPSREGIMSDLVFLFVSEITDANKKVNIKASQGIFLC